MTGHDDANDGASPSPPCEYPDGGVPGGSADADAGEEPSIFANDPVARRRSTAKVLATVGGLTALASLAAPLASLTRVFERGYTGPIYGEGIHLVDGDGQRIAADRLAVGERLTVFPEPRPDLATAPTILVRNEDDAYADDTALEHTVGGYAAFSRVCTHMGCMVSDGDSRQLVCPCHLAEFDAIEGASPISGPADQPLPQLPITLSSEGFLIATGDFLAEVGD